MREKTLLIFFIIPIIISMLNVNIVGVTVAQEVEDHDIAVVNVTPSSTLVEKGNLVNITVLVENQGNSSEIFTLNCTYDETLIEPVHVWGENVTPYNVTLAGRSEPLTLYNVTLDIGESKNVTFNWNTTIGLGDPISSPFKIKAAASAVPGETDTGDNTLISSSMVRVFASPYVAVDPHSTVNSSLTIGTDYNVSIYTDYNGSDITAYQFSLTWNPNILELVNVTNGEIIKNTTHPELVEFVPGNINNAAGSLTATYAYYVPAGMVTSGPGILAYVTFNVVGLGDSSIILGSDTYLIGWDPVAEITYKIVNGITMFHHLGNGFFQNAEVIHDVAVVSVTASPTEVVQGENITITVVIENQGTAVEDVTVNIYYDYDPAITQPIGTRTLSAIAVGENVTVTFTWNTLRIVAKTHTITAIVSELPGETDTVDNKLKGDTPVTISEKIEPPIPLELAIGIAVAVIAVIVIIMFVLRRSKKPIPE